jgi:cytochrome c553
MVVALTTGLCATSGTALADARTLAAATCTICHGEDGNSSALTYPKLAGQTAEHLDEQVRDFLSGKRKLLLRLIASPRPARQWVSSGFAGLEAGRL